MSRSSRMARSAGSKAVTHPSGRAPEVGLRMPGFFATLPADGRRELGCQKTVVRLGTECQVRAVVCTASGTCFSRRSLNFSLKSRGLWETSASTGTRGSTGMPIDALRSTGMPIEALRSQTEGSPSRQRQTRREAGTQSHGSGKAPDGQAAQKGGSVAPVRGSQPRMEAPYAQLQERA